MVRQTGKKSLTQDDEEAEEIQIKEFEGFRIKATR